MKQIFYRLLITLVVGCSAQLSYAMDLQGSLGNLTHKLQALAQLLPAAQRTGNGGPVPPSDVPPEFVIEERYQIMDRNLPIVANRKDVYFEIGLVGAGKIARLDPITKRPVERPVFNLVVYGPALSENTLNFIETTKKFMGRDVPIIQPEYPVDKLLYKKKNQLKPLVNKTFTLFDAKKEAELAASFDKITGQINTEYSQPAKRITQRFNIVFSEKRDEEPEMSVVTPYLQEAEQIIDNILNTFGEGKEHDLVKYRHIKLVRTISNVIRDFVNLINGLEKRSDDLNFRWKNIEGLQEAIKNFIDTNKQPLMDLQNRIIAHLKEISKPKEETLLEKYYSQVVREYAAKQSEERRRKILEEAERARQEAEEGDDAWGNNS